MINCDLKNTKFIFDKMKKLYPSFEMPDEIDVEVWTEILEGYSQTDILEALKAYRKNVPYNNAPTPAAFRPFLHHEKEVAAATTPAAPVSDCDGIMLHVKAIQEGRCRHNMPTYKAAVNYILEDLLCRELPVEEWQHMSKAKRYAVAMEKGLFNDFEDILCKVCRERTGKDYEFVSENQAKAAKQQSAVKMPINDNRHGEGFVNAGSVLISHYRQGA